MTIRHMVYSAYSTGRDGVCRVYSYARNRPKENIADYAVAGGGIGAAGGGVLGLGTGLVAPAVVGWALTDKVMDYINMPWPIAAAGDVVGSAVTWTTLVAPSAIVCMIAGAAAGAVVGAVGGAATGVLARGRSALFGNSGPTIDNLL